MPTPLFQTPPLEIIDFPANSQHHGGERPLDAIKYIIIHTTEGIDSRKWLSTDHNSMVSAHRLIQRYPYNPNTKMGGHYKILPDTYVANHAGHGTINIYNPNTGSYIRNLNYVSLGIELERFGSQPITVYQYDQCAAMCCEWIGLYGYLPILRHQDVDPSRRTDPVRFDWSHFYRVLHGKLAEVMR